MIEGPSRIGHYFRPGYWTSTGAGGAAESGPIIRPDGQPHDWSIEYDPEAGERQRPDHGNVRRQRANTRSQARVTSRAGPRSTASVYLNCQVGRALCRGLSGRFASTRRARMRNDGMGNAEWMKYCLRTLHMRHSVRCAGCAFALLRWRCRCTAAERRSADDLTATSRWSSSRKKSARCLVKRCFECHSGEAKELQGGLRLDSREAALKGGDTGPAIVPGKPKESLLVDAINYGDLLSDAAEVEAAGGRDRHADQVGGARRALAGWRISESARQQPPSSISPRERRLIGPGSRFRTPRARGQECRLAGWRHRPIHSRAA